jgi:hypothetical protein
LLADGLLGNLVSGWAKTMLALLPTLE